MEISEFANDYNRTTSIIIGCAIEIHKQLGPGLLESAYERCLIHELTLSGMPCREQVSLPVTYKGIALNCDYRIDLIVNEEILVELKAVEQILSIHEAQILTYMKLAKIKIGLLINFNVELLKKGLNVFPFNPSVNSVSLWFNSIKKERAPFRHPLFV
jgi:GxxExxY protein